MSKSRFWTSSILIILVLFIAYQFYAVFYNPVTTEVVNKSTTINGLDISAIIIREEQLVKTNTENSLHFEVEDSERVAKNGIIANIYASSEQSLAASELVEVQKEIADIEEIQKYNDLKAVDMSLLNKKIYDNLNNISFTVATGRFYGINEQENDLLTLLNRKQLATGKTVDFSSKLSSLKSRLNTLAAKVGNPISSVRAEKAGYFVSTIDGYEGVLTPDMIADLTPEKLDNLKPQKTEDENKMERLIKLDRSVTQSAQIVSLIFGIIGTLVLGLGMSLIMTDLVDLFGSHKVLAMVSGISIGLIGGAIAGLAYPIYNRIVKKKRKKLAPEIIRLADELTK